MKTNLKKTAMAVSVVSFMAVASSSAMATVCDRSGQCTPDPNFVGEETGIVESFLDFLNGLLA